MPALLWAFYPWEAAFLAGKCFLRYRKLGGTRRSPLPDFFIGAHAAVEGLTLLTRDASRYRTYFPTLSLIAPYLLANPKILPVAIPVDAVSKE